MKKINTFQSSRIIAGNKFKYNQCEYQVSAHETNTLKDRLVLLYIYSLPKLPLHGYKVGMTICKLGETFWHAIKSRIDAQENEVAVTSDLLENRYEKYGLDREVLFWGVCINDKDDNFKGS